MFADFGVKLAVEIVNLGVAAIEIKLGSGEFVLELVELLSRSEGKFDIMSQTLTSSTSSPCPCCRRCSTSFHRQQ